MPGYFADLHIHSCLSPCGDEDMTPSNIEAMSALKGLDMIAVADHNAGDNSQYTSLLAREDGILVVPAMEVTVKEEAHILCYFRNNHDLMEYSDYIYAHLPQIEVNLDLFTPQRIVDCEDEIVAVKDRLLISAASISLDELFKDVSEGLKGAIVPAHIDRKSYSIIANLGFIPPSLGIGCVEISRNGKIEEYMRNKFYSKYHFTTSSDAHTLGDIFEKSFSLELEEKSIEAVIDWLRK